MRGRRAERWLTAALLVVAAIAGCSTYRRDVVRTVSYATPHDSATTLGRLFGRRTAAHPGISGVDYIRRGRVSLEARLALADLAEKSLDLQYYIWDADISGRFLAERLVRAADRGVRVRVLLDDHSVVDRDTALASLSGHPNIEIRAFNPYRDRGRIGDFLTDFSRVNRRSHNKIFVADNTVAIIGGRNIADHYFGVHDDSNYRDLDIWAIGPVVPEVSAVFDAFWNSKFAVPYEAFVETTPTEADAAAQIARMRAALAADPMPYDFAEDVPALKARVLDFNEYVTWAPVRVLHDEPGKAEDPNARGIVEELFALTSNAKREILIEHAYFVPSERTLDAIAALTARGVRVRVMTNSLASNDVPAVYAGYAGHRERLLRSGVELYELRPDSAMLARWSALSEKSRSGLHTKAMVVDREHTVIGSYNFDPRSAGINTEVALLVDSPAFGHRVAEYLDEGTLPEYSYHVTLENGDLAWTAEEGGRTVVHRTEPGSTWWNRFTVGFIAMLPIESQL
jgi:putative cardiolipin synthase